MSQIGRIGGPVLSADLLRAGSDLAFETDLLYLSVADLSNPLKTVGLGVNNNSPSQKLQITGTSYFTKSDPLFPTDWIIDTQADLADLVFLTYKIQNPDSGPTGQIFIRPDQSVDPQIVTNEIRTAKLKLVDSSISTLFADDDIEITANGLGQIQFDTTDVNIDGNLIVTGNLQWDGNTITIGSDDTDQVIFNADINSNILPDVNNLYTLGSTTKKWNTVYSKNIDTLTLEAAVLTINGIDMLLPQGNTIYVSINGNDTNNGVHLHNTYRTVKHALSQAVAGDNIVIFPGTYIEDFPLTVSQGVSVSGAGIRAVTIYPSSGTNSNDAFLLNGETTVSHLSVGSFFYDSINDTGYGFRLAPNCLVTTRSPYVQNISILNKGSVTSLSDPNGFASGDAGRGALVDGSVVHPDSKEASILFHSVTFIVPNADGVTATNGARVEWLNSFTYFAYRGIHLTQGTVPSGSLIFSSNSHLSLSSAQTIGTQAYTFECFFYTASNGLQTLLGASAAVGMSIWLLGDGINPVTIIQIDRSGVDNAQYTVSPITTNTWHHIAVTRDSLNNASVFLDGVKATGATTNTANYAGPSGLIGAVWSSVYFFTGYLTQIKLAVGSNYYDPTAASISVPTAVLTTSTNTKLLLTVSTSSTYLTDTSGTQTVSNIGGVTYGTSTPFLVKSGAEFRSIGSANVYGTYGAVADGASTLGYLVGHNFAYIGTGADSQNDYDLVIQANEVVAINGGQLYYDSMDHKGDYRIGDIFYVNQQTGAITFNAQALDFSAGGSIVLEGASGRTEINARLILTGNIVVHDNNVDSILGPVNFSAQTGVTTLNTNVTVTGSLGVSGDVLVKGNVYLGNTPLDTVSVIPLLTQTIKPNVHDTFTLGDDLRLWGNAYLTSVNIDNVTQLASNTITTLTTNTDLRLVASGTGVISAPLKSVDITNNLQVTGTTTVNGTTSLKNVEIGDGTPPFGLTQTLSNPNAYSTTAFDRFGYSIAVSDSRLIVGALGEDDAGGTFSGKAYVYDLDTNFLLYTLTNPNAFGTSNYDAFGYAVAISSSYLIVGAPGEMKIDENDYENYGWTGKAYIFNATTGALLYTLDNPSPGRSGGVTEGEGFGSAVAIINTRAIVGAFIGGSDAGGRAYIYNTATGALLYTLVNPNSFGAASSDNFGFSVDISDSYAIVGAFGEDTSSTAIESGRAYIYSTTTGALLYNLNNPNPFGLSQADRFGYSVAISDSYAAVGAPGERSGPPVDWPTSGLVYIYNPATGALLRTISNPNPVGTQFADRFGSSVAILGSRLIVGAAVNEDVSNGPYGPFMRGAEDTAPLAGQGGDQSGKAYIFDIATGALLHTLNNPNAFGTVDDDYFGFSVAISNSYVVVGTQNEDDAGGTQSGKVYIFSEAPDTRTLTLVGNLNQTGDTGITGNIISVNNIIGGNYLQSSRIQIIGKYISAIDLDADINFTAGGSNGVILDSRLKITDNTISNVWSGATINAQKSIYFTPNGTGNVVINSTKAIRLPTSNDSNRVLTALGEVRLNSTTSVFEGKIAGGIIPLKGIYDSDRNTYITPELTVGANDNILRFYNNGTLTTRINTTALLNNLIHIDNIRLSGNTVNNRISGDNLIFAPNGTGAVNLNNLSFPQNTIRNNTNGALTFNSTGVGYVKFGGTYGLVIPIGTGNPAYAPGTPQNQRPTTAVIGQVRHNTTLNYMEVYNGTAWIPSTGTSGAASLAEVLDIMDLWGVVLG